MTTTICSRKSNLALMGIMILIVLFVFTMVTMFGFKLLNEMSPDILEDVAGHNESVDAFNQVNDRYAPTFNSLIVLVLIGFWVFVLVSAFMSTDHPMLFMLTMLLLIFVIISSLMLGNFYEEFYTDAEYSGVTDSFPLANFIMTHMFPINSAICISALIIAFAKSRYE